MFRGFRVNACKSEFLNCVAGDFSCSKHKIFRLHPLTRRARSVQLLDWLVHCARV